MRVLSVFGTRPEAIKMAPLVKAIAADEFFEARIAVTAQHRAMLDSVLQLFELVPDYDLDLMHPGQDLYDITSGVLLGLRNVLQTFRPDLVLVHGDTATCFSATLASFYQRIPIAHVEAGLRTGDLYSPWPEEANRVLTDHLAKWYFAPTTRNQTALINEGVDAKFITITGNTVIDALHWVLDKINASIQLQQDILAALRQAGLKIDTLEKRYVLVTGHRRESFGQGFENICTALRELALANPDVHFIYPVHLNPKVHDPVHNLLNNLPNIHLLQPLGYEPFVYLMQHCYLVLTDSGGVQEEAPSLGKPVLVMRETTERPEAVDAGTVKLLGTTTHLIRHEVQQLLDNETQYLNMSRASNPYGDGKASARIIQFLKDNHTQLAG